jgi:hypothetical protein
MEIIKDKVLNSDFAYTPARLEISQIREIIVPMDLNVWKYVAPMEYELRTIGARMGTPLPLLLNGYCIQSPTHHVANLYYNPHLGFQILTVSPIQDSEWAMAIMTMQEALYIAYKNNYYIYHNMNNGNLLGNDSAQSPNNPHSPAGRRRKVKQRKHDKRDP